MDPTELGDGNPAVQAGLAFADYLGIEVTGPADLIDAVGEHWNDEIAQDADEVIEALRECAAELAGSNT